MLITFKMKFMKDFDTFIRDYFAEAPAKKNA